MSESTVLIEQQGAVARVTLNRPDRRNSFDGPMIGELCEAFETVDRGQAVRVVVLGGAGAVFCAGADLRWMGAGGAVSSQQARADAERLVRLYRAIDECPCPVIARVQGSAFGGGVGLLAVCDVVVAAEDASFALSEARLGLVPAVIAPFLLRKAGESFMRRYALTGETFSVSTARQFDLVHDVVERNGLDKRIDELIESVFQLAPQALRRTKALLRQVVQSSEAERWRLCAEANAEARLSEEGREGIQSFTAKRTPSWAAARQERHHKPEAQ
ncbi:MAG: enoyl-CoA hydratase-related protein [Nitrospiraceae bacterium]